MNDKPVIVWFRQDLRLADNPALAAAVATKAPIIPLYILDDVSPGTWRRASASRWWLHGSLERLAESIAARGNTLVLRRGATPDVLAEIVKATGATAVYCSRAYEPWARKLELDVRDRLSPQGIELKRYVGTLLHEPDRLVTQQGKPFKVYSPFWRAMSHSLDVGKPLPAPAKLAALAKQPASDRLASWTLLPTKPDWAGGFRDAWQPGEEGARARLESFLTRAVAAYGEDRNRPDREGTSRLSPHLHMGEISPRQCWLAACLHAGTNPKAASGAEVFMKELAWREFSYHLLFHREDLPETSFRPEFEAFPWRSDAAGLRAWQKGKTGFPIVDAGMRELWSTGYMHNRVRMIAASFLIKDLMIRWQEGEAWFWDTLVDADLANNAASWQWVAGSGADAAPYFRIFNPMTQGQKFDPDGAYVKRWVPELASLPPPYVHAPWTAPDAILKIAGVTLGRTYPAPIVDHSVRRDEALEAFASLKQQAKAG